MWKWQQVSGFRGEFSQNSNVFLHLCVISSRTINRASLFVSNCSKFRKQITKRLIGKDGDGEVPWETGTGVSGYSSIAMADKSSNLQVIPADQSNQSVWLAVSNRSSLLDGRQALRTWVKSDNDACVWGARHSLHTASLHVSVRGLYSHYLHHNNEQMCKLLSERNIIVSSSHSQKIISDNYTLITPFFQFSFTAHGNTVDSLLFLSFSLSKLAAPHGRKIDRCKNAVGSGAAPGGSRQRSSSCVPGLADAHPSVP